MERERSIFLFRFPESEPWNLGQRVATNLCFHRGSEWSDQIKERLHLWMRASKLVIPRLVRLSFENVSAKAFAAPPLVLQD
jgi:hypothetical protein